MNLKPLDYNYSSSIPSVQDYMLPTSQIKRGGGGGNNANLIGGIFSAIGKMKADAKAIEDENAGMSNLQAFLKAQADGAKIEPVPAQAINLPSAETVPTGEAEKAAYDFEVAKAKAEAQAMQSQRETEAIPVPKTPNEKRAEILQLLRTSPNSSVVKSFLVPQLEEIDREEKSSALEQGLVSRGVDPAMAYAASVLGSSAGSGVAKSINMPSELEAKNKYLMAETESKKTLEQQAYEAELNLLKIKAAIDREAKNSEIYNQSAADVNKARQIAEIPKPAGPQNISDAQRRFGYFAYRANNADQIAGEIEDSGFDPASVVNVWYKPNWNNLVKDPKARQYISAKRNFLSAILRPESGAVIGEKELQDEDKKYFPTIGDDAQTVFQKRNTRLESIAGLKAMAGNEAYNAVENEYQTLKSDRTNKITKEEYDLLPVGASYVDPVSGLPAIKGK